MFGLGLIEIIILAIPVVLVIVYAIARKNASPPKN
jgi:hypothetical protein